MCRRTPLSWKESFEQGTVPVLRAQEGFGGGGYNALLEGSLCRIRPGQPGSSANLTPTKRGSALRRRSRQDSSQRVIKFQVSEASPQTDERCVAELSCNALPRPATESGSRPSYLAPKVHQDNRPGQRPGDRWVHTRQREGLREI